MNRWLLTGGGLIVGLLVFAWTVPGAWGGADGAAMEVITTISPEYTPWFDGVLAPPSGEIESLLFSIQAAVGGLIIGYYVGRRPTTDTTENTKEL